MRKSVLRLVRVLCIAMLLGSIVPVAAFADPAAPVSLGIPAPTATAARTAGLRPLNVLPLAADDEIPGVALGASPQVGSLSGNDDDYVDVYRVSMLPGQVFSAELSMPTGRSFFMEIYDPTGTSVYAYDGFQAQSSTWDMTHERVQVPSYSTGGNYYVVIWLGDDNPVWGQYSLTWQNYTIGGDDDVAGAISPAASPVPGSLDWRTDPSDVYKFNLLEDQVLNLTLTAGSGAASSVFPIGGFDMFAYQAGTTTTWGNDWPTFYANTLDGGATTATKSYYCPPLGGGSVYVEIHSELSAANYSLAWSVTNPNNTRLSGANRYETSYEISKANFYRSGTAVLASGTSFADALCASGLAGALNAPLLLVPPKIYEDGYLTDAGLAFRFECKRLGVTDLQVVGGTAAISAALLDEAEYASSALTSARYSGADRYATSASVMSRIATVMGGPRPTAIVARGDKFADALAAAPFAYTNAYPILLTKSDELPASVRTAIQAANPNNVYVLGGTAAVNQAVFDQIDGISVNVLRKDGADRYETALNFATFVVDDLGMASWNDVGLATGVNFPDALSGGAACGARGGVLLLTQPDSLNPGVGTKLTDEKAGIGRVTVFGGTSAVSANVRNQVGAILAP
ncbi:MAG: cell wall-binding repeat-containing protein [Coriobacteriia bacterium]|nr:cell wall-binding repeat-containing protein [Coriobacteriia bacterium]